MRYLVFTAGCGCVAYKVEGDVSEAALEAYNSDAAWEARRSDGSAEMADEEPEGADGVGAVTAEIAVAMLTGVLDPYVNQAPTDG